MNVSTLVFLGLAVVWAIVLLPEVLRKLSGVRSSDTIRSFNQQLAVLDRSGRQRGAVQTAGVRRVASSNVIEMGSRTGPAPATRARVVPAEVRRRRQDVLTVLGSAAVLTLLCTVAFGGPFLVLHLVADALLVSYVVMLARVTQAQPQVNHAGAGSGSDERFHASAVGRAVPAVRRIAN
jgi:hypothetical protein